MAAPEFMQKFNTGIKAGVVTPPAALNCFACKIGTDLHRPLKVAAESGDHTAVARRAGLTGGPFSARFGGGCRLGFSQIHCDGRFYYWFYYLSHRI